MESSVSLLVLPPHPAYDMTEYQITIVMACTLYRPSQYH